MGVVSSSEWWVSYLFFLEILTRIADYPRSYGFSEYAYQPIADRAGINMAEKKRKDTHHSKAPITLKPYKTVSSKIWSILER